MFVTYHVHKVADGHTNEPVQSIMPPTSLDVAEV